MKANNAPAVGRTPFQKWCDKYQGLFYLIPWIIGFVVFKAVPFGQSLYYSFTDMNFFNGISEYGLMNYIEAFTDDRITKSLITTFQYSFITVPMKLVFALFIAYILNFNIKFVNAFRTAYYIPSILGGSVAIAVLWRAVFRDDGLINTVIKMLTFGAFEGPSWLSDPDYALWVICLLRVWQFGSAMVLFLAALKGVPADLYEAATIDGAGKWRQFFSITVPMITPRRQVASVLLHHRPHDHPHHLLQPGHPDLPGVPGVQRPLHHHQRRPAQCHHPDLPAGLPVRFPAERNGHGLRSGLDHVRHRLRADAC